ncbi:MAG: hypothetical protein ACE5KS_01915, partial [Woeseiaceae bacterium]
MTSNSKLLSRVAILAVAVLGNPCPADETQIDLGGHTKTRLIAQAFPDDSIFHELTGSAAFDAEADLRVNLDVDKGPWSFD